VRASRFNILAAAGQSGLFAGRAPGQIASMTAYRGQDQGAPKLIPCGGCGTFIDPSKATYALDGKLSCPACAASGQISAAQARGSEGISVNRGWVRVAVILALVALRLLLRFGVH
jgi:hypothetical protein